MNIHTKIQELQNTPVINSWFVHIIVNVDIKQENVQKDVKQFF